MTEASTVVEVVVVPIADHSEVIDYTRSLAVGTARLRHARHLVDLANAEVGLVLESAPEVRPLAVVQLVQGTGFLVDHPVPALQLSVLERMTVLAVDGALPSLAWVTPPFAVFVLHDIYTGVALRIEGTPARVCSGHLPAPIGPGHDLESLATYAAALPGRVSRRRRSSSVHRPRACPGCGLRLRAAWSHKTTCLTCTLKDDADPCAPTT